MANDFESVDLSNVKAIHKLLVEREKETKRGVNIMMIEIAGNPPKPLIVDVVKRSPEHFYIQCDSDEEKIKNQGIIQSVNQYDTSRQYCVFFEINFSIVGTALIPFGKPKELDQAINSAISAYQLPSD
ncbi:MAG: hypothetical protein AAFN00_14955 [Cyanobacteria bacterium J06558_2]